MDRQATVLDRVLRCLVGIGRTIERQTRRVGNARVDATTDERTLNDRAGRAVEQVRDAAADFVDLAQVADNAHFEIVGGLPKQLTAGVPTIAIVEQAAVSQILEVAIALVEAAGEAEREVVVDRSADLALGSAAVVVAERDLDHAGRFVERG
ncbi:MAG: hypothetical protein EBT81_11205, partial [Gammaproteobacteria bacterium]|nr:hypothetical protein [Gammaproteobacteria bacterium]